MVPLKGGIGSIVHPPIGRKNTTYIPLIVLAEPGGLYGTYHLLGEPETTIDCTFHLKSPTTIIVEELRDVPGLILQDSIVST